MIVGVLVPAAILGVLVLLAVILVQRGREGLDTSPRALLRVYLYLASLAGIVVLAIGAGSLVNYGLARAAGDDFVYGGIPVAARPALRCPPGETRCVEPSPEQLAEQERREREQRERRRDEDLLRGVTFTLFGALFWGAHWAARRGVERADDRSALRRAYLMLGTVVFGLATVVLLPTGVYQALANLLLSSSEAVFRPGADALGGGIVTLPIWLVYLRLALLESRRPEPQAAAA